MGQDEVVEDKSISWAAFHASNQTVNSTSDSSVAISSLLPLFYEPAHSHAMIRHSMDVVRVAIEKLNPNQVPIITLDQPLYAIAKEIQWAWPETHGESKFIVLFGGLHIEMAALKVLGDLLDGSGWTETLVQAGIASSGTADSFLKAAHVTRTRRAHQVTASSLHLLMKKAYSEYSSNLRSNENLMSFEDWCISRAEGCPQFKFWFMILQLELQLMIFVRSIREGDFHLYIDALATLVPWFFSLDHTHYARWIPVHLRDMMRLKGQHPNVYAEFLAGNFTVKKTARPFSAIAIDQAHEQNNGAIKGDGGAVGLTENPSALRRWMVCGPEMARLIGEFESSMEGNQKTSNLLHHEQTPQAQRDFLKDVKSLTNVIDELGNPFNDTSSDLLKLDNRDIADQAVVNTLYNIEKLGQDEYNNFVNQRLISKSVSIHEPIKRHNLPLFRKNPTREKSRTQQQLSSLKNDCSLFSRLYVACQIRDGDLDKFFEHENQSWPPSLSAMGNLNHGTKSDLVECLESLVTSKASINRPNAEVIVLDGAAVVNMLHPGAAKTFSEYASQIFLPYLSSQIQHCKRMDVIWDVYFENSLKEDTRNTRGKGIRRRVEPSSVIPGDWQAFLRVSKNKTELFSFLAKQTVLLETECQIISTHDHDVLCKLTRNVDGLAPCTHEEADTQILLHVADAVQEGYNNFLIRTTDTDVLVLAIATVQELNISQLWIAFGTGNFFRYLAAHEMALALGPERSLALPFFHAFTGCDTVSSFNGRGKKTCWDTWKASDETPDDMTPAFIALTNTPNSVDDWINALERFVVILYDRTSGLDNVNEARKILFTQRGREICNIPPTKAALQQHVKRAVYQAAYCWGQMLVRAPELPSPNEWGWCQSNTGSWQPIWTTLPEAIDACRELLRCGCKKGCTGRCKCVKAGLKCTALCLHCGGHCRQD
jgi:hypothetical protein